MGKVIRLTELDLVRIINKVIREQPDSKLDTPYNKELMRRYQSKLQQPSLSFDDTVDIISAIFDGVPGLGSLTSAGIDIIHVISYIVRYNLEEDEYKKIEYAIMAVLTLCTTFLPLEGNVLNILARKGLRGVINTTPRSILSILKKYGLSRKGQLLLKQEPWKYSFLILICRILGRKVVDLYVQSILKLKNLDKETKEYSSVNNPIKNFIETLEKLKPHLEVALVVAEELNKTEDIQATQ